MGVPLGVCNDCLLCQRYRSLHQVGAVGGDGDFQVFDRLHNLTSVNRSLAHRVEYKKVPVEGSDVGVRRPAAAVVRYQPCQESLFRTSRARVWGVNIGGPLTGSLTSIQAPSSTMRYSSQIGQRGCGIAEN